MIAKNKKNQKGQVLLLSVFILTFALIGMFLILNPISQKLYLIQSFNDVYKAYNNAISGLNLIIYCIDITTSSSPLDGAYVSFSSSTCKEYISIKSATDISNTNQCYEIFATSGVCRQKNIVSTGSISEINFTGYTYYFKASSYKHSFYLNSARSHNNIKNIIYVQK